VAVGYLRKHSLAGGYPDIRVDYSKLRLSMGSLPGLCEVSAELEEGIGGTGFCLRFKWTVLPEDREWPRCNDQVMLMAYCPDAADANDRACFVLAAALRTAGEDTLALPVAFEGRDVEVYIAVISTDRSAVSDSQYLGRRNVLI